jgi:ankyrin repeat protein
MTIDVNQLLLDAAEAGDCDAIEHALRLGAYLHAFDDDALCRAAGAGRNDAVDMLISLGSHLHAGNDEALHRAARNGHTDTVELLLNCGAYIHAGDDDALYWAASGGHTKTVSFLLERGANIDAKDGEVLKIAVANRHQDTSLLLLRQGADPAALLPRHEEQLQEWLQELRQETAILLGDLSLKRHDFFDGHALRNEVLDTCSTGQFPYLVAAPLINSGNVSSRNVFQNIWDELPAHWQRQYQNCYIQFLKEGGFSRPSLQSMALSR